jgi:hypothetical protein
VCVGGWLAGRLAGWLAEWWLPEENIEFPSAHARSSTLLLACPARRT